MARRLVVDRRLAQTVTQAGPVLNREVFATHAVVDVVLDVLGVPNDDWRPTVWEIY